MLLACIFSQPDELCVCVCAHIGFPPVFPILLAPNHTFFSLFLFLSVYHFQLISATCNQSRIHIKLRGQTDESDRKKNLSILRYNSFGRKKKSFRSSGGLPGFSVLLFVFHRSFKHESFCITAWQAF